MSNMKIACVLGTLASVATAEWIPTTMLQNEHKHAVHLELAFGVTHPPAGRERLESALLQRSSPDSPLYGQWLSNEDVHAMVKPEDAHVESVVSHLVDNGVDASAISYPTPNKDWVLASVTVEQAERILGGEYIHYKDTDTNKVITRLAPWSKVDLPLHVQAAIDVVEPASKLPPSPRVAKKHKHKHQKDTRIFPRGHPQYFRDIYNVTEVGHPATNPTGHAVTAFLEQFYLEADMAQFWSEYGKPASGADKPNVKLVGDATTGSFAGGESMLDIEYINAMGANIHSEFWGFSGRNPSVPSNHQNEPFLKWLYVLGNTTDATVPKIMSTSYVEEEDSVTEDYSDRCNVEFMKAGLRGISLLYASGDEGANCKKRTLVPQWPSSSPWITAVGGTDGERPESAAGLSSGGFSNRYSLQSWQRDRVNAYINSGLSTLPEKGSYNATGRAYPDISAVAIDVIIVLNGKDTPLDGTSCASPITAGVFALLVDARLAANKTSLGFLNPLIYSASMANALNDVTSGHSYGCDSVAPSGWPATAGYDLATGMGTPNYVQMKEVVLSLP